MRRDVFIDNDSGGFSVIAAAAADAIIADDRSDDLQFVSSHRALLQLLYGDDAMPVRIVVDEPLLPEEAAQWLARSSWRIDAPDGRLLVMGGFDPFVLATWKEEHGPDEDGRGVAVVQAAPGSWRVDVYAHTGSMNARAILAGCGEAPGAFFRRCHPERSFPVWLAKMLEWNGGDDPGHEELWRDVAASYESGDLAIDAESASAVGMLIHVTRYAGEPLEAPDGGWFDVETGQRVPEVFPIGLPAGVPDRELEGFLDRLLRRPKPLEVIPIATELIPIVDRWSGGAPARLAGGEQALAPTEAFLLYWMAGLGSDSSPRFEVRVSPGGPWTTPPASAECAVVAQADASIAIGPPPHTGGWFTWWSARRAAEALSGVPDGSTLCLAMAPDQGDEGANPAAGRALYRGPVRAGVWQIAEASPPIARETLAEALAFARDLAERGRIALRGAEERRAFDATAEIFPQPGSLVWEGDAVRLAEPEERMLLILAAPVFRTRFGADWPTDPIETGLDEDDD